MRGCDMAEGLRLDRLEVRLAGEVLVRVDQHIAPGEILTVMGPSGSGKSTLLAAITGTLPPKFELSGRVVLDGEDVTRLPVEARRIGILFQDEMLFPHLSVEANLAFGLNAAVRGRRARQRRVEAALSDVGLDGFARRDPTTLSGGQRARVALMRMLLSDPRAALLDEPFSKLDMALRDQVRRMVFDQARARNLPVLQVTHDPADATAAGGRRIVLGEATD